MNENVNVVEEVEANEVEIETKESIGTKLKEGIKRHKKEIAGVAMTGLCSYIAYKYGVHVGIKSVDVKPIVEAVSENIDDVVDTIQDATEF